jgi:hypothetical protein
MIMGMARVEISSFNPNMATNQTVKVVPILEPNITPIPAFRVINPALINDITRTDIRELEFRIAVEKMPMPMLLNKLLVDLFRMIRRGPSVNILNPFSRFRIPNNKTVTPTPISINEGYRKSTIANRVQKIRKKILRFLMVNSIL